MREFPHDLLAEARAASIMPWPPDRVQFYRGLFPLLSFWLPEEESVRLRREFQTELARLEAAGRVHPETNARQLHGSRPAPR